MSCRYCLKPSGALYTCEECKTKQQTRLLALYLAYPDKSKNWIFCQSLKQRNREFVWNYLIQNPCVDCGNTDIRVLEFDHRDQKLKKLNISQMITGKQTIGNIMNEICKCDVRCANCHKIRTGKQLGWYKSNK